MTSDSPARVEHSRYYKITKWHSKINHNLEQQAQAIYKNWFVDFEPFRDREFIDSELGRIPMGWRVGSFTELGKILGGGTPKTNKPQYWEGNIPFFTPKDVDGIYALLTEKSITTEGLANCNSALFPINSVFVTARGTVGKVSLAGIEMAMNQSCYAIYGKEHVGQFFIYGMTQNTVASLRHKSSGAVFNAIVTRDFESERIVIPEISVLQDYEQVVNPIFVGILENSKQSYTLAALRDALLPKLMSGEIDVSNVKI